MTLRPKIVWKYSRWQHHVNYKPFIRNQLKLRPGVAIPEGINEYGMVLAEARGIELCPV